ncbi:MAG: sigma 54-interacting transcriptional regulator [Proteobacteria bacterium]|nr:PAS domain-containing protein [Desulfobulbaceae bacterium]MBU4154293.1 sigma 54-interacting transcriptional regulator [Pseudomonadota bacterium]
MSAKYPLTTLSDTILDSIADGVFTVDPELNITFFNKSAEKITGVSQKEAIGQKCFDVFRANICQSTCAIKQSIQSGKEVINLSINILNSRDCKIPISVSTSVLRDEAGNIIGGVSTFRDMSTIENLRKELTQQYIFEDIISKNHKIRQILSTLPDIATSNSTVLIEGPSGAGKELFSQAIHTLSNRKGKFIALNCAALPDSLLESELFGYKKGAFTEAKKDKKGRFALAEKGTIFLDEIGDISPALQLRLLRVLQEKEYEPLGGTVTEKADVRVVAATNKCLADLVGCGHFRDDLFFRLNVIKIVIPPLHERKEDIPLLVEHFLSKFNAIKEREIESVNQEVMSMLMKYDYPGNIRELENIIEYCFVLCHDRVISKKHLPAEFAECMTEISCEPKKRSHAPLPEAEAAVILDALQKFNGCRMVTAEYLGIEKTTLWRKMKRYGIDFAPEKIKSH